MWNLTIPEKLSCSSGARGKTGYATRRWPFFFVSLGWYFRMRNFLLTGILPSSRGRCGAWSFKINHHDAISDILTHLHSFWPFQDTQTSPIGARCSSSERHVTWLWRYQFSFYLALLDCIITGTGKRVLNCFPNYFLLCHLVSYAPTHIAWPEFWKASGGSY